MMFTVDAQTTSLWCRLTRFYWGRVLLLGLGVGSAFGVFGVFAPGMVKVDYSWLAIAVVLACACRNGRQFQLVSAVVGFHTGWRVEPMLTGPSVGTVLLFAFSALVTAITIMGAVVFRDRGALAGWLRFDDGRELPIVLGLCQCGRTDHQHYVAFAVGEPIELEAGVEYGLGIPHGPRALRVSLSLHEDGDRVFLRSLSQELPRC